MDYEELARQARRAYGRADGRSGNVQQAGSTVDFPSPPDRPLRPSEFLDRLVVAAFESSAQLRHPFYIKLGRGEWNRGQLQEWVRQEYQHTVCAIRRHALVAANATEFTQVWALITRVKIEADADPVGGV